MPEYNGVSYGEVGTRGETCGMFHEFLPGPDHMCACCRLSPNHPVIKKANKWLKKHGHSTVFGSKGWGEGLIAWDKAGRP